jgi:DNA-binding CsgD family transcriptional regulator
MNNNNKLPAWYETLSLVINRSFSAEAIAELLKGLENFVDAGSAMITIYPHAKPPKTTHHRLLANEDPKLQIETYDSGAYLLDPFYRKAIDDKAEGAFSINMVAPTGFEESEYFDLFYKRLGFSDEICILIQLDELVVASISLVRHIGMPSFTHQDIDNLNIAFPLIKSMMIKWRQSISGLDTPNLEWQLDNALVNFGTSKLTPRESKILHMMLHGYAIKTIAEKLKNSIETIKHHRKNIYAKLDVSSQSELFYLFIASLKAMPEGATADPLEFLE